jgi:hypothetical protein
MKNRVTGVSLMGLIAILVVVAVVAVFGMKIIPSFLEFRAAKNAITAIAREKPQGPATEIRRLFENRANIDGIESLTPAQLEIGKGTIAFAYRKEIPLFTGVGVYIDYTASAGAPQ